MEVTSKSKAAYGQFIQENIDQNINVEQENDNKALESSSSAAMTPLINNNVFDNETPIKPWIIVNTNVTDLFQQYRRHVVLGELMPANTAKISYSDFIKVTDTINAVDNKSISIREGKRDLLNLATLTKLPRLPILDMSKIGEVELQSMYFDVFLSEIIADQDQQVDQELTDIRPDATVSTFVQNDFGCSLGFGETRPDNVSTTKKIVNLDIFRLGITCKRAID